ncbi:hypothetical protein RUESEDTHA_02705 [Ruegeria sp. THAF57]|uniref:hypothetical protein n=1 Tax=Ruegeria sp. THAF57 TaxID=2744555 RepID=UPI0015DFD977|nr:hypothetical protein [Ruegeria sp. THAF57]CAD0185805.1 hypothetical protein RUESEDTHA_02705 [Ruegeria sp. THAF57]
MRKTGHYRRAAHVRGEQLTLEQSFDLCSDGYPNVGHPIFQYADGLDCVVASHARRHGRQEIHLAVFEAGAGAAVVETLAQVRVDEEPAPAQKEFIRSQVFLICSGEDIIFSTHNAPLRDSRVNLLINNLIRTFSGVDETPVYLLEAALDEAQYREIMDQGIGEIDLGMSGFKQTLEHAINGGAIEQTGIMGVVASLWQRDLTAADREAATKIAGRFVLRSGKDWKDAHVKRVMTDMAMELLDGGSDDGFAIVTKNGLRITQDSVRLKDDFSVDGNRQVVSRHQMFAGLHSAIDRFEELGVIGDEILIEPNEH